MTNYEWVKENQEDVIQKALARNMTIHKDEVINMITNNDDVVKESIISYCSVDKHANKIVVGEVAHIDDRHYLFRYNDVAKWLDEEHVEKVKEAYPEGTVLVGSNGRWYWYCGINSVRDKHIVYTAPLGLTSYNPYYREVYDDEFFKHNFEPLNPNVVVDNKRNLIVAVAKTDK